MADAIAEARAQLAKKFAASNGRIGGKGSVRRTKVAVHKATSQDDKKLQTTLKRLNVNNIPGIEEVRGAARQAGRRRRRRWQRTAE